MVVHTKYKILETHNLSVFSLGEKKFVYVNLVVESPEGEKKEFNHQTFTFDYWYEMIHHGYIYKRETIGENIMVGDYYN